MTKKVQNIIMISVFLLFIFGFTIAGIIEKDRDFSEMENRNLAQFPEFSFSALKDNSYTSDLESYFSDQIFLKDSLVSLKTDCERAFLKSYQNGVYFSDDGYILQGYTENKNQIDRNLGFINKWADKVDVPVNFLLVPNGISVLSDKLPGINFNDNQLDSIDYIKENLNSRISFLSAYDALKKANDNGIQVYYKTDHHWTTDGAYEGFKALMDSMGEKTIPVDYDISTVENFYGTLYSKAPSGFIESENMHFYTNPKGVYSVFNVAQNTTSDTMINDSFLSVKDKYTSFLGGNFKELKITSNAENKEKILILKDSYANAAIPFLADQFADITVIDMRYYHFAQLSVSDYIKENKIDRVIMLYNMDFINSDDNFVWLT